VGERDALRRAAAAVVAAATGAERWDAAAWLRTELGTDAPVPAASLAAASVARQALASVGRLTSGPADVGRLYEAMLTPGARDAGAHYTPPALAAAVVDLAFTDEVAARDDLRVWDPACGGGVFLLAVAARLRAAGRSAATILGQHLVGTDLDPGAVLVSRAALAWWAHEVDGAAATADGVVVGDALAEPVGAASGPFDLVVGNPPFQSQLRGSTVRTPAETAALRQRFPGLVGAYTDTAALFLAEACRRLGPGGRAALILPTSVLAARDAQAVRTEVESTCDLVGLWVAGVPVFDAQVEVCAPVLARRPGPDDDPVSTSSTTPEVRRWRGPDVLAIPSGRGGSTVAARSSGPGRWAVHGLAALGVPDPGFRSVGVLDDLIVTTAGFRDEYYGLVGHVVEAPDDADPDGDDWPAHLAPLVTTGLVDVGSTGWGRRSTAFAKQTFQRPAVDLRSLAAAGGRADLWVQTNLVPKVVVATQTRVGEAAVDERGRWVASVPSIVARVLDPADRWRVAAVICSPVGSVAAMAATAGTARSATAIKPTAASVRQLPVPVDAAAWDRGAAALAAADLARFAVAMADAYAVDAADREALAEWWHASRPGGRFGADGSVV
jgi:SAM-dependent methyltransferase